MSNHQSLLRLCASISASGFMRRRPGKDIRRLPVGSRRCDKETRASGSGSVWAPVPAFSLTAPSSTHILAGVPVFL